MEVPCEQQPVAGMSPRSSLTREEANANATQGKYRKAVETPTGLADQWKGR